MRTLATGQDPTAFARAAHSLAGSSSIFGLSEFWEQALKLEAHVKAGSRQEYAPAMAALEAEFDTLQPWLEARLADLVKAGAPPKGQP